MPLSPREIKITIIKNRTVVIVTDNPTPAKYLLALNALLYKSWTGLRTESIIANAVDLSEISFI
jgi:hypothetical protein